MPSVSDEIDVRVVDVPPPQHEIEEDVALTPKDKDTIKELITASNKHSGFWGFIKEYGAMIGIIIFVLTQWSGYLEFKTHTNDKLDAISEKLTQIQGQLAKQSVITQTSLGPKDFGANLSALADSLTTVRQQKIQVPNAIVSNLREKMATADLHAPGYWQAAAELVSYHPQKASQDQTKNCLGRSLPEFPDVPNPNAFIQSFSDCTLVIDDLESLRADPGFQRFVAGIPTHPNVWSIEFHLNRVHVIYRGGTIIPVTNFIFQDCTFDFALPTVPPDRGQKLVRELLAANPNEPIQVSISG